VRRLVPKEKGKTVQGGELSSERKKENHVVNDPISAKRNREKGGWKKIKD